MKIQLIRKALYQQSELSGAAMETAGRVATIRVIDSHGYAHSSSHLRQVILRGKLAEAVGLVKMNLIIVDITHIKGVKPGDEVVLIGRNGRKAITAASFGELSDQLNYELLTRMPRIIPRVAVD